MPQRLLEGEFENVIDMDDKTNAEELRQLRQENRKLDEALRTVRNELGQAIADKENLERSIRALRNQLSPLHRYLRALFGEIELAVGEEDAVRTPSGPVAAAASVNGSDPRWESYKATFPGTGAKMIDALLVHQEMNVTNMATLLHADKRTIYKAGEKLRAAGALAFNGGMFSLKR
jgi:hypothetical protein